MTASRPLRFTPPAVILLCAILAVGYDGSPPRSRTGAPAIGGMSAESNCRGCHGNNALNSGGSITLLNPPAYYVPGSTYTLTVRLASTGTAANSGRLWGFQLTAVKAGDGAGAGTLVDVSGQGTMVTTGTSSFASRQYSEVGSENHSGLSSPVTWQVRWTAPDPGVGDVHFYFCGVAANGTGSASGDWVYTGSYVMPDMATPTLRSTWGQIKTRYR